MTARRPLIAIVDDDPSVCRALKRLLRSCDMDADVFLDGSELLAHLGGSPHYRPDCCVIDVQMATLGGIELQARLADLKTGFPIVFISAYEDDSAQALALSRGAHAWLRKPFDDEVFLRTVREAIAARP